MTQIAPPPMTASPAASSLLAASDPPAFLVEQAEGSSDFVLSCDHADHRLPSRLGTLGLSETELSGPVAWDIGAGSVARLLAQRLEATLVLQNYSRLVIDCDREPGAAGSIPERSEWLTIKGNENLAPADIAAREAEVFAPYHAALSDILDGRQRARRRTLLVSIGSFSPQHRGDDRPWQISVCYGEDSRLAEVLLKLLRRDERLLVGDNQPSAIDDSDGDRAVAGYSLPTHGQARGLVHVGLQIRQDLIADLAGQKTWAGRLSSLLKQASGMLDGA